MEALKLTGLRMSMDNWVLKPVSYRVLLYSLIIFLLFLLLKSTMPELSTLAVLSPWSAGTLAPGTPEV